MCSFPSLQTRLRERCLRVGIRVEYSAEEMSGSTRRELSFPPAGGSEHGSSGQPMDTDVNMDHESPAPSSLSSWSSSPELISKPPGEAGRRNRGGYNLQESLRGNGWEKDQYLRMRVSSFRIPSMVRRLIYFGRCMSCLGSTNTSTREYPSCLKTRTRLRTSLMM